MDDVRIGSRGGSLVLVPHEEDVSVMVRLEAERLSAFTRPRDRYDLRGLPEYFEELAARSVTGWQRSQDWESLEGDIRITATCQDRRVVLGVQLRNECAEPANQGWVAHLDVTLDPGEELRQTATDVWHLLEAP